MTKPYLSVITLLFTLSAQAADRCEMAAAVSCGEPGIKSELSRFMSSVKSVVRHGSGAATGEVTWFDNGAHTQPLKLAMRDPSGASARGLTVDTHAPDTCQTIKGYGFSLTESTVMNYRRLPPAQRKQMMEQFFSREKGANFTKIVLPLSSTDFSDTAKGDFSVCDCGSKTPDPGSSCFDPSRLKDSMELLRQARAINPDVEVVLKPWTTPPYMKNPDSIANNPSPYKGGSFDIKWSESLAQCLVKSVDWVRKQGVPVASVAVQNEPGLSLPYPSVYMDNESLARTLDHVQTGLATVSPSTQLVFRSDNFCSAGDTLDTIHRMSNPPKNGVFLAHCYSNDPDSSKRLLPPGKELFCGHGETIEYGMGECSATGQPHDGDFGWWMQHRVMLDTQMGAGEVFAWNGMLDEAYGPQNHGCDRCRGMLTSDFSDPRHPKLTVNPEMRAIAAIARYAQPGATRLLPKLPDGAPDSLFFRNPDGSTAAVLWNGAEAPVQLRMLTEDCREIPVSVPPHAAVSLRWR